MYVIFACVFLCLYVFVHVTTCMSVYSCKGEWEGRPHLGLEAEDGDRNGHDSSDDHGDDDSFGVVHAGGTAEASAPSNPPPLSVPVHPTPVHSQYLEMVPVMKPMASVCKDKLM